MDQTDRSATTGDRARPAPLGPTLERIEATDGFLSQRVFEARGEWLRAARLRQGAPRQIVTSTGDEHAMIIALDGPVRVERWVGARHERVTVPLHGVTTMPANTQDAWRFTRTDVLHLHFSPDTIERHLMERGERPPRSFEPRFCLGDLDPTAKHLALALLAEDATARPDPLFLDSIGLAFLKVFVDRYASYRRADILAPRRPLFGLVDDPRLARAVDYIEAHFRSSLSLDEIATAAGASSSWLTARFREATGVSVWSFVQRRRLQAACALLSDASIPLAAVADACGFSSQSHMTRAFTARVGITPGRLRLDDTVDLAEVAASLRG